MHRANQNSKLERCPQNVLHRLQAGLRAAEDRRSGIVGTIQMSSRISIQKRIVIRFREPGISEIAGNLKDARPVGKHFSVIGQKTNQKELLPELNPNTQSSNFIY